MLWHYKTIVPRDCTTTRCGWHFVSIDRLVAFTFDCSASNKSEFRVRDWQHTPVANAGISTVTRLGAEVATAAC